MKYILPLLLCLPVFAIAQPNIYDLPKIVPITPNAAALEKFGSTPVNYATGIPEISYPFWNWNRGRLSFNLGLSYHAGGHKVDDMASNTGLGWTLTGLGRISRTVRGIADDDVTHGFMFTPVLPAATTYAYDGDFYTVTNPSTFASNIAITSSNVSYADTIRMINENQLDGEQDVFSFTINGHSGRFVFDKNKTIVPLEHTNCRIEPKYYSYSGATPTGPIVSFTITDDKGIVYRFEHEEQQYSVTTITTDISTTYTASQSVVSGWLLTKIIDPMSGDSVTVHYSDQSGVAYESGFSESQSYELEHYESGSGLVVSGMLLSSDSYSISEITNNDPQPTYIDFPDGTRLDFNYAFSRDDLAGSTALTKVKVTNTSGRIIKWYQLNYDYFSSSSETAISHASSNDFSKRLKLTGINEVSNDSSVVKPTTFTYNSTELNKRGSKNTDYWGYNISPDRNNAYYVPKIKLEDEEVAINPLHGRYLNGANRSPDSTYVKAAILEKIDYPTGGSTTFEYECNRAYSATDYYEDSVMITAINWNSTDFNSAFSLPMSGRTSVGVRLLLGTSEFSTRPEHLPDGFSSCLEEQQDMQNATFTIASTDSAFSTNVTDTYAHFLGGVVANLNLPSGKTYNVTFSYDTSVLCNYIYPFKATLGGSFYITPQDKLAGGLRIKKITQYDSINNMLVKAYDYNDSLGHSSATLDVIPSFGYYRSVVVATTYALRHINRTSNPTNTLNYYNGSPLVYKRVREKEVDKSFTERRFDSIVSVSNGGTGFYPYLPSQDLQNQSGLMIRQDIMDKDSVVKNTQFMHYTKTQTYHLNPENRNIKTGVIGSTSATFPNYYVADQYFMYTSDADQTIDTLVTYENGVSMTSIHNKFYNDKHYLDSTTATDSKGRAQTTAYLYTDAFAGTAIYDSMISKNMISQQIQQTNYLNHASVQSVKSNYHDWGNGILAPQTVEVKNGADTLDTRLQYYNYDATGNVLELSKKDDAVHSYLYDYHNTFAVAETVNAAFGSVAYTSFEADGKGNWDYNSSGVRDSSVTGKKSYDLGVGYIQRTALSSGTTYVITYWLQGGGDSTSINSGSGGTALITKNGWTLYQREITGITTATISGTGKIDELRLYPKTSQMTTYTYEPLVGITSRCDANNRIIYYEYDSLGRLLHVRDQDKNILSLNQYQYKEAQ